MPIIEAYIKPSEIRRRRFVQEYLTNGFNSVAAVEAAGYKATRYQRKKTAWRILQQRKTIIEIKKKLKKMSDDIEITFDYKMRKLKRVIDEAIPDSGDINLAKARVAITAISETNKMQGHYEAQKIQVDSKEMHDVKELVDKFKKEY